MGCCVDRNEALVWECYSIQSLVHFMGIGCGAVGRVVVSETRDMCLIPVINNFHIEYYIIEKINDQLKRLVRFMCANCLALRSTA